MEYNAVGDKGAEFISKSTTLTNLTHLELYNSKIGKKGVEFISKSITLTNLTKFDY